MRTVTFIVLEAAVHNLFLRAIGAGPCPTVLTLFIALCRKNISLM